MLLLISRAIQLSPTGRVKIPKVMPGIEFETSVMAGQAINPYAIEVKNFNIADK